MLYYRESRLKCLLVVWFTHTFPVLKFAVYKALNICFSIPIQAVVRIAFVPDLSKCVPRTRSRERTMSVSLKLTLKQIKKTFVFEKNHRVRIIRKFQFEKNAHVRIFRVGNKLFSPINLGVRTIRGSVFICTKCLIYTGIHTFLYSYNHACFILLCKYCIVSRKPYLAGW